MINSSTRLPSSASSALLSPSASMLSSSSALLLLVVSTFPASSPSTFITDSALCSPFRPLLLTGRWRERLSAGSKACWSAISMRDVGVLTDFSALLGALSFSLSSTTSFLSSSSSSLADDSSYSFSDSSDLRSSTCFSSIASFCLSCSMSALSFKVSSRNLSDSTCLLPAFRFALCFSSLIGLDPSSLPFPCAFLCSSATCRLSARFSLTLLCRAASFKSSCSCSTFICSAFSLSFTLCSFLSDSLAASIVLSFFCIISASAPDTPGEAAAAASASLPLLFASFNFASAALHFFSARSARCRSCSSIA
mmetsp:Transcript_18135/g.41141  ORF Transcript_18135/g.41141 Transcript_18135/m.41141 type:complete len:308 (-) Transcript_18135:249-1172(-)